MKKSELKQLIKEQIKSILKESKYSKSKKMIGGVTIVNADTDFDDNPLFYVWTEYPKYKQLDKRNYLRFMYEFYTDSKHNKYFVWDGSEFITDEEIKELIQKANWSMSRNVDAFVNGADKTDYAKWLEDIK